MKKIKILIIFFLPLILLSHKQDKELFSTSDILPGAVILLDRSGSMGWDADLYDTTETVTRTTVILSGFNNNHSHHVEGWYDEDIWPDGPGAMSDFDGAHADDVWRLTVRGENSGDSAVVVNWRLRFYNGGSYTEFDGGSFSLRTSQRSVTDAINVSGVGTVDSVACYVSVYAYSYDYYDRWGRRRHHDTELGNIQIGLEGPAIALNLERLTRIQVALEVIHSLLDADGDGYITEVDKDFLTIKLGQGCHRNTIAYTPRVTPPNESYNFTSPMSGYWHSRSGYVNHAVYSYNETTKKWNTIANGTYTMRTDTIGTPFLTIWNHINYAEPFGATPNGPLLAEGVTYIRNYRTAHPELWCMKQNIILITDGETNEHEDCSNDAKDLVYQAYKAWHNDSIKVFAVGFGDDITAAGANQLNWTAFHGRTQAADSAFIDSMIHAGMDTTRVIGSRCDMRDPNDVSHNFLTGYAFIANDASSLALALKKVLREIAGQREKAFSSAEVTSIEEDYTATEYEARMYLASFYPDADPFWEGHLRSVRLVPGGLSFENIPDSLLIWDAGDLLRDRNPDTRNIYGIKGGSIQELNSSNFNATDFAVGSSAEAEEIVNLVRCGNSLDDSIAYLGDIFHSSPLRVGYPSYWYSDDGFAQYRDNMISRDPLIYAGSNTGLIHAFYDETGEEAFAVVPENFVPEIKALADSHRFYVDADPMAADVWFPSEASDTFKDADEWKTVLMACQGEGGRGITCLDVTNPASLPPGHLFSIYDTAAMGYTTSVPVMFKVAKEVGTDTVERFFAFFGGGEWPESMYNIYSPGSEVRGNVIVAVDIYGAYTSGLSGSNYLFIPAASGDESKMVYPFASAASVVNLNSRWDNLYDLLYIPDLAGQLWKVDLRDPDISSWRARCIFQPPIPADTTQDSLWQPAFFAPLVEREPATGCLWLFYGTGNRSMVFKENTDNRFYAILDTLTDTTNYPLTEDNLKRVWTEGPFDFPSEFPDYRGWYIVYSDSSTHVDEKTVSQASLFLDTLKFVTFEPTEFSSDCNIGTGGAREYSYHFRTGSGRFKNMGGGIPQAPRYSFDQSGSGYEIHQTSDSLWVEQKTGFGTLKRILQWKER